MAVKTIGLLIEASSGPGVLHQTTGVIARHEGDITLVEIIERGSEVDRLYLEVEVPEGREALFAATTVRSQSMPFEMKVFDPFSM